MNFNRFLTLLALIIIATLSRLFPHPFNFTPMIAIALFGGAYMKNIFQAVALPIHILLITDTIIEIQTGFGFHSGTLLVYVAFASIALASMYLLKKVTLGNLFFASVSGSLFFFLLTNFAFFYPISAVPNPILGQYPHSMIGIVASYEAGLPFLKNQILGDLVYCGLLFGTFALLEKKFTAIRMA